VVLGVVVEGVVGDDCCCVCVAFGSWVLGVPEEGD
jgi:hypothetical protein